jgi:DNA-binding NarL/FixJ family response regulator
MKMADRQPVQVVLIDDSVSVRRRLADLLDELENVVLVGEARSADEGLELLTSLQPDVVILDVRMPGRSGIGLLEDMQRVDPRPAVIVLTNYPYVAYRRRCMDLGAQYFFDKSSQFNRVSDVLNEIAAG